MRTKVDIIEIDGSDYMRFSKDNWYVRMGEAWEPVLWNESTEKLEKTFKEINKKDSKK